MEISRHVMQVSHFLCKPVGMGSSSLITMVTGQPAWPAAASTNRNGMGGRCSSMKAAGWEQKIFTHIHTLSCSTLCQGVVQGAQHDDADHRRNDETVLTAEASSPGDWSRGLGRTRRQPCFGPQVLCHNHQTPFPHAMQRGRTMQGVMPWAESCYAE